MQKSIFELLIGNLDEKHAYRQLNKRVKALPKDYRFAFRKMQQYMYYYGAADCDITMIVDLLDLFEESALKEIAVLDLIGNDVAAFCDDLIHASKNDEVITREKLNREIFEYFHKEEKQP